MQRHEVYCEVFNGTKSVTLNDLEMPFSVEICFLRRFDQIFSASLSEATT